jgi:iron(III) transport system ATP-binding protein
MLEFNTLEIANLSKQFPGMPIPVVQDVSFKLHQGELLSLLGPSGCGKTTLLRLIAGFEQAQAGSIDIAGQLVLSEGHDLPPEQRNVGMVFQDYALFPHLTVAANVAFGLKKSSRKPKGYPAKRVKEIVRSTIEKVGLAGLEKRYPHELSGGQQQRVALARALAPEPALVLLDEPLSNLDVQVRSRLRQEIRAILKATKTAAIFVTHDQEEALSISDRIAVMRNGRIEQLDTPEAIYHNPETRFVAEFVTQANFLPAIQNGPGWRTAIGQLTLPRVLDPVSPTAELMIRQQDLGLRPDPDGTVVIVDQQFLGREYRYILKTSAGHRLQALSNIYPPLSVGDRVQLIVNPLRIRLFSSFEP